MISPPFTTEQLSQVLIVGNACGQWQPLAQGLNFIFNGTEATDLEANGESVARSQQCASGAASPQTAPQKSLKASIINIANGGYAQSDAAFVVQSQCLSQMQCQDFTQQLHKMAQHLSVRLNCWPSSGLTCFALMSQVAPVQVSRMSLLPSLTRSQEMTDAQYLPCVVHNWLGERRIALELMIQAVKHRPIHWPELLLTPKAPSVTHKPQALHKAQSPTSTTPLTAFQSLHELASTAPTSSSQYQHSLMTFHALSKLNADDWQGALCQGQLQTELVNAEALFVDQSLQQHPCMRPDNAHKLKRHWYLADNSASQYLDSIRQCLALCQQRLTLG